jgi:hypothetical protein
MSEVKQYAERDLMAMDIAGNHYCRHVSAMTREQLHSKSDIAAELGWRDMKIAELKAQRDALAAENAIMLKLLTDISENHVEYFSEGESGLFAGVPLDYVSEINMYVSRDVNAENPFPATDAYLNSVRAEGVEICISSCDACVNSGGTWPPLGSMREIARKLRAGKDGE